ncbi:ribonuclease H-like domain-containing protein [Podospora didyma]|uniref:Ribonuclease H-like domain-containing protein n=1 Tax=Podospora didyma TaxID=330526 RepID=A0AAE0NHG4_9PEZI|nr:ribonuclease H-like domain-containing protein [Podospora didyma]
MADNFNRGRGRGRGGGGGGRGDFQPRGGGYQGGGGRGDYQPRGGAGYQGGGGRGDVQPRGGGYQGGGGRGDYQPGRGGGGGYRGGRGGSYDGKVFGQGSSIPPPDPQVTDLENRWIAQNNESTAQLAGKMGKLSVGGGSSKGPSEFMPSRPAFGTVGQEVILWVNSFQLDITASAMYKYTVEVTYRPAALTEATTTTTPTTPNTPNTPKGPKKPKTPKTPSFPKGSGNAKTKKEAKGKKLAHIIGLALKKLQADGPFASEFKANVITLKKLNLPQANIVVVEYTEPNKDWVENWAVKFTPPQSLHINALVNYLKTMDDKANDSTFPKFPDEIDALGIVLGHTARSDLNASAVGRSRFFATDDKRIETAQMGFTSILSIVRGYFQSVRPATGRLLLNTNVTHTVFRRAAPLLDIFGGMNLNVMDKLETLGHRQQGVAMDLARLHRFLNTSRVRMRVPTGEPGKFVVIDRTIAGLACQGDGKDEPENERPVFKQFRFGGPAGVKFFLRAPKSGNNAPLKGLKYGAFVTVAEYYLAKYNIKANLSLPLINIGSPARPVYALAELCMVLPGQSVKAKLSPREQDAMIRFACRSPPSNAKSITTSARDLLGLDNNQLLRTFGITVSKDLVTVKARELRPPVIAYMGAKPILPDNGSWLMKGVKIVKAGRPIKSWSFIFLGQKSGADSVKSTLQNFTDFMTKNMGIKFSDPKPLDGGFAANNSAELEAAFRRLASLRADLVLVVLPKKETTTYNMVKKMGDVDFGIQTVCVVQEKICQEKGQFGYFANVGLKVNLKFGGVNHKLKDEFGLIKSGKTMVVGYDVTHPTNLGPDAGDNAPSMVGLVASVDADLAQWPAVAWSNPSKVEMLGKELIEKFRSRLRLWQNKNQGRLPDNILIYRDGVSEGQFKAVLDDELLHIREACTMMYKAGSSPRITLIVSVKRHQTRFFPTDAGHIHSGSKSPREGTVVDRGVTNVRYWDFFLQAHASLQGTARPAHYTVLLDEIFRADYGAAAANTLEKVTHDMCYLFGRATKAVSICPPAYYADLVCTRARVHMNELFDDTASISSKDFNDITRRTLHANLIDTMFYI